MVLDMYATDVELRLSDQEFCNSCGDNCKGTYANKHCEYRNQSAYSSDGVYVAIANCGDC